MLARELQELGVHWTVLDICYLQNPKNYIPPSMVPVTIDKATSVIV